MKQLVVNSFLIEWKIYPKTRNSRLENTEKKPWSMQRAEKNKKIGYRLKHLEIFKSILKRWNKYRKRPTDAEYLTRKQNANDSLENHVQNVQNWKR